MPCNDCSRAENCPPCVNEPAPEEHDFVSPAHCGVCMQSWLPRGSVPESDPPMSSEEEEEVSQDFPFVQTCVKPGCIYDVRKDCFHGCRAAAEELAEEAHEMAQDALEDDWRPPQPERRPPYAVAYSVGGHLYELHVPGDAAVKAEDGALVIQHHLGPVAGIVQVLPVLNERGADGAEADQ